jgi:hypothetical protein
MKKKVTKKAPRKMSYSKRQQKGSDLRIPRLHLWIIQTCEVRNVGT